jgi:hypothetical protein
MEQETSAMNHKRLFAVPVVVFAVILLALFAAARADEDHDKLGPYKLMTTIPIPGDLVGGFDISWVDSEASRYYLADRGSSPGVTPIIPPHIDVIDTKHNKLLPSLPVLFAGNGVVAIRKSNDDDDDWEGARELWVGDANSHVEVIDLKTKAIVANINTMGAARADELAYDPLDHLILIANDRDPIPFVTFISTKTRMVVGQLKFPQVVFATPPSTTPTGHGLEQSVWDSRTRKFYLAVPATSANHAGEVDEIDPPEGTALANITRIFKTTCNPAGLVLVPGQRLVTSCGDVIDVKTGSLVTTVAGTGGDEIWFNPGDERVYFGNFFTVPVVDTDTNTLVTTLTVGFALPPPATFLDFHFTHSVAADGENNRIFVPVTHEGVKVYTDDRDDHDHHHDE